MRKLSIRETSAGIVVYDRTGSGEVKALYDCLGDAMWNWFCENQKFRKFVSPIDGCTIHEPIEDCHCNQCENIND